VCVCDWRGRGCLPQQRALPASRARLPGHPPAHTPFAKHRHTFDAATPAYQKLTGAAGAQIERAYAWLRTAAVDIATAWPHGRHDTCLTAAAAAAPVLARPCPAAPTSVRPDHCARPAGAPGGLPS
jgi:hypothetical protein